MLLHREADVDLPESGADRLREPSRIVKRAFRRAKGGHRDRENVLSRDFQKVKGAGRDEEGQSGIEAAADSEHGLLRPDMRESFLKAEGLDAQDLLAAPRSLLPAGGDEGVRIDPAEKTSLFPGAPGKGAPRKEGGTASLEEAEGNSPVALRARRRISAKPRPFLPDPLEVDLRDREPRRESPALR